MTRNQFLKTAIGLCLIKSYKPRHIETVLGAMRVQKMGLTLIHEHCLVDFIGADAIRYDRWDKAEVVDKVLPFLLEAKSKGIETLMDCTPAFLGRDVHVLKMLSEKSGINILTNTGYYGAVDYKYLPSWVYTDTVDQLAARWIDEANHGIEGTAIKPGFIKISVNGNKLSDIERKLIQTAGITHRETGLTICSHTGPAVAALDQLQELKSLKVNPNAFIWTHAQNELNKTYYTQIAKMGAWVSLDGMGWGGLENYVQWLDLLKANDCLHRVLISHDAGWYDPAKAQGGTLKGYTDIIDKTIPLLIQKGFKSRHIDQLLIKNPAEAFAIHTRIHA